MKRWTVTLDGNPWMVEDFDTVMMPYWTLRCVLEKSEHLTNVEIHDERHGRVDEVKRYWHKPNEHEVRTLPWKPGHGRCTYVSSERDGIIEWTMEEK